MQREGILGLVDQDRRRAWLWQWAESVFPFPNVQIAG